MPGRRCAASRKIKPARTLPCVIVGYVPGRYGFRRLFVAHPGGRFASYVASLHSGFSDGVRAQTGKLLAARVRCRPVVGCPSEAVGVEPDLYCQVRFLEWTHAGRCCTAPVSALARRLRSVRHPLPVRCSDPQHESSLGLTAIRLIPIRLSDLTFFVSALRMVRGRLCYHDRPQSGAVSLEVVPLVPNSIGRCPPFRPNS